MNIFLPARNASHGDAGGWPQCLEWIGFALTALSLFFIPRLASKR